MALWKRASKYYVEFTAPDGTRVRRSTGTSDRRKAEEYHDRLKAELWEASRLKKKPKRTWDEAALRWLKEKAHKKSRRDDVQRIRWFTTHLRGKRLDEVSRDMIDRLLTTRLPKATDATRNRYMALIRAIFRKAQREWEWVDQIPAFKAYGEGSKIRVRHLTHEQAEALLEALPDHQREVVLFALTPGHAGWHELYTSNWENALSFYSELFGWEKADSVDMGSMGIYQLFGKDGTAFGGMMNKPGEMPNPVWTYYFNVDGIEAAAARLKERREIGRAHV